MAEQGGCDSHCVTIPGEDDQVDGSDNVDQMAEQQGWDSHFVPIPGEDSQVEQYDSGYWSGDESAKPLTKDEKDAIKYDQLPFLKKHYLLTYIQRILEETCVRYARNHLSTFFSDPKWKQVNLLFQSKACSDNRLVRKNWLDDDEIELEFWMKTFGERIHGMPKNQHIFQAVMDLRNAAVHRGIPAMKDDGDPMDPFTYMDLIQAVKLPQLLGDEQANEDVSNAMRCVMDDETLDEETKTATEMEMKKPQPCTSRYQFLARIQTMLEETCFNTAVSRIPHVMNRGAWRCHEQLEITKYDELFFRYNIRGRNEDNLFPEMDAEPSLAYFINDARIHTRNVAHHRLDDDHGLLTGHGKLVKQTHNAIMFCVLLGDWKQAIEIEVTAEMFLTGRERGQVLERLERAYRVGKGEGEYEKRRRVELEIFLKEQGLEGEEKEVGLLDKKDDGEEVKGWRGETWSPSMHPELLRREVMVVVDGFVNEEEGGDLGRWEEVEMRDEFDETEGEKTDSKL